MLFCAVKADAIVIRGRGYYVPSTATSYSTWTNAYMSYRTVWHDYQSNGVESATNSIAYDWGVWDSDATNKPASSEPVLTILHTNAVGMVINGYTFDGINDYQVMAESRGIDPQTWDFTVSAWCKPTTVDGNIQAVFRDNGTTAGWSLGIHANTNWYFGCLDSGSDTAFFSNTFNTVTINTWHHLVGVRSNTTVYLYVDGVLLGTNKNSALDSVYTFAGNPPTIGSYRGSAQFFDGIIGNVNMYAGIVFSPTDVTNEYAKTDHAGITGLGDMEDSGRNFIDPLSTMLGYNFRTLNGTNVADYSGNGYTGYLYGSPARKEYGTNEHGVIGYAYAFTNGGGQYINANSAISAVQTASDLTISMWVKQNNIADNANAMFSATDSGDANSYFYVRMYGSGVDGKIDFRIDENNVSKLNAISSSAVMVAGTWHHVVLELGTGGNVLWVDGKYAPVTYTTGTSATTNTPACIGDIDDIRFGSLKIGGTEYNTLNGDLSSPRIYTRDLSNPELVRLYHWSKNRNDLQVYP